MAQQVLTNVKLWLAQYDLSGDMNSIAFAVNPDMLDNTVFGNTAKNRKKGMDAVQVNCEGFWGGSSEDAIWNGFNATTVPMTFGPITGAAGEAAYAMLAQTAQYSVGGAVGEMIKFNVQAENVGGKLVRGTLLFNGSDTATDVGTAYQLGAVATGYKLYACLHVTAALADDTLDVIIQSDIAGGFADPTTRITFTQKTAIGYQWATPVAGPIVDGAEADDWWRVSYTIGGISPNFSFVVFMAIVPD